MGIYDFFSILEPYFFSVKLIKNFIGVEISFPEKWEIEETKTDLITIVRITDEGHEKRFLFAVKFNEENLNFLIETILLLLKKNREAEDKAILFSEKIKEMKLLFEKEDLTTLMNLEIGIREKEEKNDK